MHRREFSPFSIESVSLGNASARRNWALFDAIMNALTLRPGRFQPSWLTLEKNPATKFLDFFRGQDPEHTRGLRTDRRSIFLNLQVDLNWRAMLNRMRESFLSAAANRVVSVQA
jgi:hypothetical protein